MTLGKSVRKAVIPAAGLGTRFLPATKAMPKEMLPVVDQPAIQYVVEEAVRAGLTDLLMITGRQKRALEDHFDRAPCPGARPWSSRAIWTGWRPSSTPPAWARCTTSARATPKGLGHAVLCARQHVGDEPFAVLLGDDLIDERDELLTTMIEVQARTGGSVVALIEVDPSQISAYGCADISAVRGRGLRPGEPPRGKACRRRGAPSNLAVIGRYVLHPEVFDVLEDTEPGRGGEIQLTDALQTLAVSDCEGGGVYGVVFRGRRYDTGDKLSYLKAVISIASERVEFGEELRAWMKAFVS